MGRASGDKLLRAVAQNDCTGTARDYPSAFAVSSTSEGVDTTKPSAMYGDQRTFHIAGAMKVYQQHVQVFDESPSACGNCGNICDDSFDNDGDGLVDSADPGCASQLRD